MIQLCSSSVSIFPQLFKPSLFPVLIINLRRITMIRHNPNLLIKSLNWFTTFPISAFFISHYLAVVKNVCDRVVVMYLGKLCEINACERLYQTPLHPHTTALLGAIPIPDPLRLPSKLPLMSGEMPSPLSPISGCRFKTRCPKAVDLCENKEPLLDEITTGHWVACYFADKLKACTT